MCKVNRHWECCDTNQISKISKLKRLHGQIRISLCINRVVGVQLCELKNSCSHWLFYIFIINYACRWWWNVTCNFCGNNFTKTVMLIYFWWPEFDGVLVFVIVCFNTSSTTVLNVFVHYLFLQFVIVCICNTA